MNTNRINRSIRLTQSRHLGRHSKQEWSEMKIFFENTCVKCYGGSGLLNVERDHIIPIYQNGSDGIDNIQPLCARCNASKGPDNFDYRPEAAKRLKKKLPIIYTKKSI